MAPSNTLLTPTVIAKMALSILKNNLTMASKVNRSWEKEWTNSPGILPGSTVTIRKPNMFTAVSGRTATPENLSEPSTTLLVNQQYNASWSFYSDDLTLTVEDYAKRYLEPAVVPLANKVDQYLASLYTQIPNTVGTAGTTPADFTNITAIKTRMTQIAAPYRNRTLVVDPTASAALANGLKGIMQPTLVQNYIEAAEVGRVAGLDIFEDANIYTHTAGIATSQTTPATAATGTLTGASITSTNWTASQTGILKAGDVITFASVYDVNPISKATLPYLKQFTITADVNSGAGAGAATLTIAPAIVATGSYQNVSAAPLNGAAITVLTAPATLQQSVQSLAFVPETFALACVPMHMPEGAVWGARESADNLSIRITKAYDQIYDFETCRLDILFGGKAVYPETGVRLLG